MSKEDEEILRAILEKGSDSAKKAAAEALSAQPSLPDDPAPVRQAKQKKKVKGFGQVIGKIGKSKFYKDKKGNIVDQNGQPLTGRLADILSQETATKKAAVQQAVAPTATVSQDQKNAERQIGGALSRVVKATSNLTKTQGKVLTTIPNVFGEVEKVITNLTQQHEKVVSTLIKQNDDLRDKVVEALTGVKTGTKAGGAKSKPSKGVGGSKAAKAGQVKAAVAKKAAREEKETRQKKEVAEKPTFAGQMKNTAKSMGIMAIAGAAAGALANVSGVGQGPPPGGGPGGAPAGGPGGAGAAPGGMWPNTPSSGNNKQVLETIKKRESGGNYNAQAKGSSASGAYQFIDSTWRARAKAAGVDTNQYPRAVNAPPEIQDKVADVYISEILSKNNNDVSKIPLVWYTGNAAGQMSSAALAANNGLTPQAYQASWMKTYQQMGGNVASATPSAPTGAPTAAPAAPAAPTGAPEGGPAGAGGGDIVALGKELQGQENIRVSENPAFGGVNPVHKGKGHYEGRAIDVNAGTGIVEAEHPIWGPKFDQIASSARQRGFMVIWRSAGHFNHMHIESKTAGGQAPGGDTTTGEPVAIAADSKSPQLQAGRTLAAASQQNAATELLGASQGGMIVMQNDRFVNNTRTVYQTASYSPRKMEQAFNPYNLAAGVITGRGLF